MRDYFRTMRGFSKGDDQGKKGGRLRKRDKIFFFLEEGETFIKEE